MPSRKAYLFFIGSDDVIHSHEQGQRNWTLCGKQLQGIWWESGWLPANYLRCQACLRLRPRNKEGAIEQSDPFIRYAMDEDVVHERDRKDASLTLCGHTLGTVWMQRQYRVAGDPACEACRSRSKELESQRRLMGTGVKGRKKRSSRRGSQGTSTPENIRQIIADAEREGRRTQSHGSPKGGTERGIRIVGGGLPGLGKRR